jgi:hypothetical protein
MGGGAVNAPSIGGGARAAVVGGSFAAATVGNRGGAQFAGGGWNRGGNWQGGGWRHHHRGFGRGVAAGFIAGSSLGYYGNDYAYGPDYYPGYYDDSYAYADDDAVAVAGSDDAASCAARFRSYDPRSGTYLGYDGLRHPCP